MHATNTAPAGSKDTRTEHRVDERLGPTGRSSALVCFLWLALVLGQWLRTADWGMAQLGQISLDESGQLMRRPVPDIGPLGSTEVLVASTVLMLAMCLLMPMMPRIDPRSRSRLGSVARRSVEAGTTHRTPSMLLWYGYPESGKRNLPPISSRPADQEHP